MHGDRKRILSVRQNLSTDFWDEVAFLKLQLSCLLKYAINLYASHNLFSVIMPTKYIEQVNLFLASYMKGNISRNNKIIYSMTLFLGGEQPKFWG